MKTIAAFIALCSVCFGNPTVLHNGVTVLKDNVGNQIAVTPIATAIGVPVASVQPGGTLYAQGHDIAQLVAEIQALRAEVQALKSGATALAKPSLLTAHCSKCHSGQQAKGSFDIAKLTPEARGKAIQSIASGKMPKDVPNLVADIRLKLINELTGAADAKPAEKQ